MTSRRENVQGYRHRIATDAASIDDFSKHIDMLCVFRNVGDVGIKTLPTCLRQYAGESRQPDCRPKESLFGGLGSCRATVEGNYKSLDVVGWRRERTKGFVKGFLAKHPGCYRPHRPLSTVRLCQRRQRRKAIPHLHQVRRDVNPNL
jgi:hypothetical protein